MTLQLIRLWSFYRDGFRDMRLGRTLWTVILIKLVILFVLAKLLLPDQLQHYSTDRERAAHVLGQLTRLPSRP